MKIVVLQGSPRKDVYNGIIETYKQIVDYSSAADVGVKCVNGADQKTDANRKMMVEFGSSIK